MLPLSTGREANQGEGTLGERLSEKKGEVVGQYQ
jgi:hypothetical protein